MVSELDTRWCACEKAKPRRGVIRGGVLGRTLGPKGGVLGLGGPTSIGEGNECQRGRWAPKGGGLWDPTSVEEENETSLIKVWKPLPSRRVLKTLRESLKEKSQRGQYLLAMSLGRYSCYINNFSAYFEMWNFHRKLQIRWILTLPNPSSLLDSAKWVRYVSACIYVFLFYIKNHYLARIQTKSFFSFESRLFYVGPS